MYLVGPNLAGWSSVRIRPDGFRMWVLLHELTHRAQFTGVPWMREHFTGLVEQSLASPTPTRPRSWRRCESALRNRRDAARPLRDRGMIGLVAGPEQRAVMAQVGGLMSLLEGHGDVTMKRAAGALVPGRRTLRAHPARAPSHEQPAEPPRHATAGVEAKLDQYAAGRAVHRRGRGGGRRPSRRPCWRGAGEAPDARGDPLAVDWLARIRAAVAR